MEQIEVKDKSYVIQILKKELQRRQRINPKFSLRGFANKLQISPAQLSQLLNGKRNFTAATVAKISSALNLSPIQEEKLFVNAFSCRKSFTKEEIVKRQLSDDEFSLVADWYHYAILSLAKLPKAKSDPDWISKRLGISRIEALGAIRRMQRLGILEDGQFLRQKGPFLNVESKISSAAIQKYHRQIIQLAEARLSSMPVERRDYSAMTFFANPEKIDVARKMIEKFQDELTDFMSDEDATEVYILANQLFSLEGKYA